MKLNQTQKKELLSQLKIHKANATSKSINIIRGNVLIEHNSYNQFKLISTDLNNTLITRFNAISHNSEKCVIDIDSLSRSLSFDSKDEIELRLENDKLFVGNSILDYCSHELYPIVPEREYEREIFLFPETIFELIEALDFVGNDSSNQIYSGVQLRIDKIERKHLIMATNSKVIYCNNVNSPLLFGEHDYIVLSRDFIKLIKKLYSKDLGLSIKANENVVEVTYNGSTIISNLLEGKYPMAEVVFKKKHEKSFLVGYPDFKKMIDNLQKIDKELISKVTTKKDCLEFQVKTDLTEGTYSIHSINLNEEFTFGIRADTIKKCLSLKQDSLSISYGEDKEPFIINVTEDKKVAFMPVRLE